MRTRRADFRRRARAAIGWAAALFVVVQQGSGLVLDYARPLVRFPTAKAVLDVARQDPAPPEFAFFGSSRTGAALHPDQLSATLSEPGRPAPRVVTLAVPAGDAVSMEFLLDRLLATGPTPRWAVIEISPETVNAENGWWMPLHVLRQLNWDDVPTYAGLALKGNAGWIYLESRLVPTYTYRKQIVAETRAAVRDWLPTRRLLAAPVPRPSPRSPASPLNWSEIIQAPPKPETAQLLENSRVGAATTARKALRRYRVGGPVVAALERTLDRCRAAGVRVVLLGVPTCSAHRAEYTPDIEAAYDAYVHRLTAEYGCRYLDGRAWVPDTQFLDTLHVDPDGKEHFTQRLGQALKGLR